MQNRIYFQYLKHNEPNNLEFERIESFYIENKDPNVRDRPESVMIAAYENKQILYAEDASSKIVASSGTFGYLEDSFWEAGADRVTLNGYGLQGILQAIRAINTYIMTPDYQDYFALHSKGNIASERSLTKVGFTQWNPPANLLQERSRKLAITSSSEVVYYHLDHSSYKKIARYLLSFINSPIIERGHGTVVLDFSRIGVFQDQDYISYIEEIAS